jgi:hypothetical protein
MLSVADADLTQEVIQASLRLINASRTSEVDGEDVAREIGREADDIDVYYAFREADRVGELEIQAWRGGMGLPHCVRLPRVG